MTTRTTTTRRRNHRNHRKELVNVIAKVCLAIFIAAIIISLVLLAKFLAYRMEANALYEQSLVSRNGMTPEMRADFDHINSISNRVLISYVKLIPLWILAIASHLFWNTKAFPSLKLRIQKWINK